MIARLRDYFFPLPLPVLKEMPAHVRNLHLDPGALWLHIQGAHSPNPNTIVGHIKPSREQR